MSGMIKSNLDDIAIFVTIAEKGSFVGAAKLLKLPTSTVSRRLSRLEEEMAVKLIERSSRTLHLTEAGQALFTQAQPHVVGLRECSQFIQSFNGAMRGKLIVAAPIFMSNFMISDWLVEFQLIYPDIEIELRIGNQLENILDQKINLAIRPGPLQDSSLVARKLYTPRMGIYASPTWVANNPAINSPTDLDGRAVLSIDWQARQWNLVKGKTSHVVNPVMRNVSNDFYPLHKSLVAGLGIAVLPTILAEPSIASGKLQRVLPDYKVQAKGDVYGVYPSKQYMAKKTVVLLDFIQQKFNQLYN